MMTDNDSTFCGPETDSDSTFSGPEMDNDTTLGGPYLAALEEEWDGIENFFRKENACALSSILSAAGDTAFHLAVFSNKEQPLKHLLDITKGDPIVQYAYLEKNNYGNTALHEAAAIGNVEAVKLLVKHDKEFSNEDENTEFLEGRNEEGETPLFKAAAYGRTKVVKFLASKESKQLIRETEHIYTESRKGKKVEYTKLKDIHRQIKKEGKPEPSKPPSPSILHVAIRGEYFETALLLLKLDKGLATLKDENGWTSLHLLATMPSAFKSGYHMATLISRVFYFCLPIDDRIDDEKGSCFNLSKGVRFGDNVDDNELCCLNLFKGWWILGKICSPARKICEAKRKHKLAFRLAKRLIAKDDLWIEDVIIPAISLPDSYEQGDIRAGAPIEEDSKPSPLFLATERGIIKIVKNMLKFCPQLVEYKNHLNLNILHVAIKHRQKKIFDHVKRMKIPMTRLVREIDKNGYTILHHAANTRDDTRKIHPAGPIYELQEELKWYKRVEKMTPPHYLMLPDSKDNKTCEELFNMKHNKLLDEAQRRVKETSQSCFAVAVLAATVLFTAVYNVPGGSNDKGYPVFLDDNLFIFFTVMVIVAFVCSLTSVVMFLLVFTSPITYEEFVHRLPRKLAIGYTLLFVSLSTTMLAFVAAFFLVFRSQKPRWTTTLVYTAAFLPVSIFALTQFPMYFTFKVTLLKFYKWIKKIPRSKWFKKRLATKFQRSKCKKWTRKKAREAIDCQEYA